jgi:hypothetical protein
MNTSLISYFPGRLATALVELNEKFGKNGQGFSWELL